jgi:membrane-associated protease RseP (regulator of RpoE activity)
MQPVLPPTETNETAALTQLVGRWLVIEDVTLGDPKRDYLVRYRGRLRGDSQAAYDALAAALRPHDLTPIFREEDEAHVVLLVPGVVVVKPSNPWINLVLFGLTAVSVVFAGALSAYGGPLVRDEPNLLGIPLRGFVTGIPFAVSLLAILLAHEFGHYLAGRAHGTAVTLPYFIPFPISLFGTMGAFINMKEPPKNRRDLLDIGIAGPLAGLIVAIPVLLLGLSLSEVRPLTPVVGQGFQLEGNSLLYLAAKFAVFGKLLPEPSSYGDLAPALYWLRYFFTAHPAPLGGLDVMLHPIAWAGWAGLLVTALNLIPAGQLDGGHLIYVLLGQRMQRLRPWVLLLLAAAGFAWSGWWFWAVLIFFLGRGHAELLDQITPLDPRRKRLAALGLIVFLLTFTPVPLVEFFF